MVELPPNAPARIVNITPLIRRYPTKLASFLGATLDTRPVTPFKLPSITILFSDLVRPVENITSEQVLAAKTARPENVRVDLAAQLFDPRGCSEFGIWIAFGRSTTELTTPTSYLVVAARLFPQSTGCAFVASTTRAVTRRLSRSTL